jgi:nitrous oxidase accessory protein NosD
MTRRFRTFSAGLAAVALAAAGLVAAVPASAKAAPMNVWVAPTGTPHRPGSCTHPDFNNVQDAIEGVRLGGTVTVCPGTYPGMINIDRRLTLIGEPGATVDATGDSYGIGISASGSAVMHMKVMNASPLDPDNGQLADGIVTLALGPNGPVAADHVRILFNEVTGNLGSGIDINSSSFSSATFNNAHDNGVGINLADDIGLPANNNSVLFNTTDSNFGGCGIALADHTGVGVSNNRIAFNTSDNNGLATATAPEASAGSGVILASPVPGGIVKNNTITQNEFHGNGHGGVVVHAHAPGSDFSGNSVTYNRIGRNNVRTDENDLKTTGVYLGSNSAMSITVENNTIGPDHYGIFASGPVTITGAGNTFQNVDTELGTAPNF